MDFKKHLQDLRTKMANHHMSLMVGSGFSKNANSKFPSWDELLLDLVYEMHNTQIDQSFREFARNSVRKGVDKDDFIKDRCKEIIKKRGYLDVVSDYLRTSFPEAITTYIEARTPFISKLKDQSMILQIGSKQEPFSSEHLNLHNALIRLPWNNIYTTNYDQLLELCVDEKEYSRLSKEIFQIEKNIVEIELNIKKIDEENIQLDQDEASEQENLFSNIRNQTRPNLGAETDSEIKRKERRAILLETKRIAVLKKMYGKSEARVKEDRLNDCFNIVRAATDLRLKRNKNIIKLHGSLRSLEQKEKHFFEFDNDNKKQYVIAREDYESYPVKHEAFTQLMRISLLQESFCLVGFSGDDPNFHAWIAWVRDILQREKAEDKQKSYKIYLIDVNNEHQGPEFELFYENHHIVRIPITSDEVVEFLKSDLCLTFDHQLGRREIVQLFISFLGNDNNIKPLVDTPDSSAQSQWKDLWSKVIHSNKFWEECAENDSLVSNLDAVNQRIEIPNLMYTDKQATFLNSFIYENLRYPERSVSIGALKLIIYAIKDRYIPIRQVLEPSAIAKMEKIPAVAKDVKDLLEKNQTIELLENPANQSGYLKVISLAFRFKFEELHEYLKIWQPSASEVRIKAGFLSLIDPNGALAYLQKELVQLNRFSPEQRLYALENEILITGAISFPRDPKLMNLLRAYENAGFKPVYENFEYLLKQVESTEEKPKPRGAGRYSVGRGNYNDFDHYRPYVLQYLMLLIISGSQFNIRRTYWLKEEKWYTILKWGYELYPHAFLFYSLQFSDSNFLKRLGEEYAYSGKINNSVLEIIAANLFSAVPNAPYVYQESIRIFLSRMLKGVHPKIWEKPYMHLFRESVTAGIAFKELHLNPLNELNNFAFQYLEQESHILEILHLMLTNTGVDSKDVSINSLYYLGKNVHYKFLDKKSVEASKIPFAIDRIIAELKAEKVQALFVISNSKRLLTEKQKYAISDTIDHFDFENINDPRTFEVINEFVRKNSNSVKRLKQSILQSKFLWNTGRLTDNSRSDPKPILLNEITQLRENKGVIKWTNKELYLLYRLMGPALSDLLEEFKRPDPFFSYNDLIFQMIWFLDSFESILKGQPQYKEKHSAIYALHRSNTNYEALEDGLMSDAHADVVWALSEVNHLYKKQKADFDLVFIVLNKCLLQADPALEAALSYVASWIQDKEYLLGYPGVKKLLTRILKKYKRHPITHSDIAFVQERLILIAYAMRDSNIIDEIITWWIDDAENSRFNNVRQLVFLKTMTVSA